MSLKPSLHAAARRILPPQLKRRVVSFAFKLDRPAFVEIAHDRLYAPDMELGLRKLAKRGLTPTSIVDIGAFNGHWSQMARKIWPKAQILMLEANTEKRDLLTDVANEIEADLEFALMGPEDGTKVDFYVMEAGSSILSENSPLERRIEQRQTARLDTVLQGRKPAFLKLDVQGFELEVLRGAPEALAAAQAVLLEVSLIEINKGAPLLADVVSFMNEKGFEVCDVLEMHRRPLDRATNQVDLLFVPAASPLLSDTRHFAN